MTDQAAAAPRPVPRRATPLPAGVRALPRLVAFTRSLDARAADLGGARRAGAGGPGRPDGAGRGGLRRRADRSGPGRAPRRAQRGPGGRVHRTSRRDAARRRHSRRACCVPDRWGTLIQGIVDGVGAIPGTFVPYRGGDEWVRRTLLLGGTALTAIAVLQAFWPRERGRAPGSAAAATVSLGTLYAVPVISHTTSRPFLSGALFTLLLLAFLLADRIRAQAIAPAALLVLVATVAAAATAPVLDRPTPWVNYEKIAEDVASRGTVGYSWDHSYAPLDWPRDGRELLRIKAQSRVVLEGRGARHVRRARVAARAERGRARAGRDAGPRATRSGSRRSTCR